MMHNKKTLVELFHDQVKLTPHHTALSDSRTFMSYGELDAISNKIANYLQTQGIQEDDFVAVLLESSISFLICILAIIKLGAVYLPLDMQAPQERIQMILDEVGCKALIFKDKNPEFFGLKYLINDLLEKSKDCLAIFKYKHNDPNKPVVMFYTSGSTGKPKGVLISNQAIFNLVKTVNYIGVQPGEIIAQFSNMAFDASTFEIWSALLNGGSLFLVPPRARGNYANLEKILSEHQVRYIFFPTSYFHQLIKLAPKTVDQVGVLIFGGEQLNTKLISDFLSYRKHARLPIKLINAYGPSETTTACFRKVMDETFALHKAKLEGIGKPIENMKAYVLDQNRSPVKKGKIGELYLSGVGLALGYYNSLTQNEEKFIPNPFSREALFQTLYKTGDLVKEAQNGEFLYIGRVDDQVKISGFRVHLNEIETTLLKCPGVSFASLLVEQGGGGHNMLVAYLVPSSPDIALNCDEIRSFLARKLPPYMLPAKYFQVEKMPLTSVGKIDKKKLQAIPHDLLISDDILDSESILSEKLKEIFGGLLNRKTIDANKNFFELGANSLIITEAVMMINKELECSLQIVDVLTYPSIRKLSQYLEGGVKIVSSTARDKSVPLDIAIVGMSCRFPGANSLEEFWDNLCEGEESLTRFEDLYLEKDKNTADDKVFIPVKGVISGIDQFDAGFFGLNPSDACILDPQQRIFLECAWEALEHSGTIPNKHPDKAISVFAGMADSSYLQENLLQSDWFREEGDWFKARIATSIGTLATHLSYYLNLHGKSININTACSTGLVAIEQACQDLTLKHSDVALVAGVSIELNQRTGYFYEEGGIESKDGHCRPFSDQATGTIFSDGVGVVVLKRLEDAIKDQDTVYAVIRGCGVNNDGAEKVGYAAPSTMGQAGAIHAALNQAQLSPEKIDFIETHGTATALGDLIEFTALGQVYNCAPKEHTWVLGSVKSNIGHTDIAAGMASLIKAALCLYHQKIPPTLHFKNPSPAISLSKSQFRINADLFDWDSKNNKKRYAGVSAFGIGGTNAHVILEELPTMEGASREPFFENKLFLLSAKNEKALERNVLNIVEQLKMHPLKNSSSYLSDVAYTLQTGRDDFQWRCMAVGGAANELIANLQKSTSVLCKRGATQNIVFMFPGQSAQYHQMARELFEKNIYFAAQIIECTDLAKAYLDIEILPIIMSPNDARLNQTQYSQIALFIIEYALAKLFIYFGITPSALIGHSIGEYVAACLAGVFSLEDAIKVVCMRGHLMATAQAGEMLAIACTVEEFYAFSDGIDVELAAHNAIKNCVASGSAEMIAQLQTKLDQKEVFYQKLLVSHAFHSGLMESVSQEFMKRMTNIQLSVPKIPVISNLTGLWLTAKEAVDVNYWRKHLRFTVQFQKGIETLLADAYSCFVEIGPGHTLSSFVKENTQKDSENVSVISTLPNHKKNLSDDYQLLLALGKLWESGIAINWSAFYAEEKRKHVALPTYAFQRKRYWIEASSDSKTNREISKKSDDWFFEPTWVRRASYQSLEGISENAKERSWLIFSDGSDLALALVSELKTQGIEPFIVEISSNYQKINHLHYQVSPAKKTDYEQLFSRLQYEIKLPLVILHLFSYSMDCPSVISDAAIDQALEYSFYSSLYAIQAYLDHFGNERPLKYVMLTKDSQHILKNDPLNPVNASLTGICRVTPVEHPSIKCLLMDLNFDPHDLGPVAASIINRSIEVAWSPAHCILAMQHGYQWELAYSPVKLTRKHIRFKDRGVYLFTGGLGGISLTLCEAIAKKVNQPVFILLSRTPFPPMSDWDMILEDDQKKKMHKKVKTLQNLQALGATLHIAKGDVTEFNSLQAIVTDVREKYGLLNGVIHAAGVAGGGLVQLKDKETADKVFLPKLYGAYHLAHALSEHQLDFVVLCSSVSALIGEPGQVDYAAANACLDAIPYANLFKSDLVVSINWNSWQSVGMVIDTDRPDDITFLDRGNDITPLQGGELFMKILENNAPQIAVSKLDIGMLSETMLDKKEKPLSIPSKIDRDELNIDTSYNAPRNETEGRLVELWQDSLAIQSISIDDDFFALGGHSLKALRLIQTINKTLNCKLSLATLYEVPTIAQLAEMIAFGAHDQASDAIVPLHISENARCNIFMLHPVGGTVFPYQTLVSQWALPCSLYGVQDPGIATGKISSSSLMEMAQNYLADIKKIQPSGPYCFVGYSFGGTLAYEIANLLQREGQKIELLLMIDGWAIFSKEQFNESKFKELMAHYNKGMSEDMISLSWQRMCFLLSHVPSRTQIDIVLLKAMHLLDEYQKVDDAYNGWKKFTTGQINVYNLEADHESILSLEGLKILSILEQELRKALDFSGC